MERLGPLVRVRGVQPLESYKVQLTFEDGSKKEVDLAPYLRGPIFDAIRQSPDVFRSIKVVGSTVGWDNGADIDPDVLYYNLTPAGQDAKETAC
jgi:hypothetical protein